MRDRFARHFNAGLLFEFHSGILFASERSMKESSESTAISNATRDAVAIVQAIGQSLNMATLYGMGHKVTRVSLEGSYAALALFLDLYGKMDVDVADGGLLINGNANEAPLAGAFATKLTAHDLLSFEIVKGFTLDEYVALFAILITSPAKLGGTADAKLNEGGVFSHIQARSIEYRRVAKGEGESGSAPASATPAEETPAEDVVPLPDLDNVLAFLKNDKAADAQRSADDIRQLAGDAEKLAELILRTVEVRAASANLAGGESLTDIVVGTIGKIVAELTTPAAVRTEKGRKQVKRSLMILEKVVLQKLQQIAGNTSSEAAAAMLDEAAESLDMDAMASKLVKTRKAVEESEEKVRRLIAKTGDDPEQLAALHETMVSRGLTEEGWQELMISRESAKGVGDGDSVSGIADIKALTLLLAKLGETLDQSRPAPSVEEVRALADATSRQIEAVVTRTEKKIAVLRHMLGQEGVDGSGKPDLLSRRQLMEILAEIGQELSQPLTVVTASIDMLRAQHPGLLTEAQGELLAMAASSTARLAHLVNCLIRISGNPKTPHPNQAIRDVLYSE